MRGEIHGSKDLAEDESRLSGDGRREEKNLEAKGGKRLTPLRLRAFTKTTILNEKRKGVGR